MSSLAEMQHRFRLDLPRYAGYFGECLSEAWLLREKWKFSPIEQAPGTKPERLKNFNGKRPDFFLEPEAGEKTIYFFEAKCYSTNDGTTFALKDAELRGLKGFKAWFEAESQLEAEVLFLLFPKEMQGLRFVWVLLSEFDTGVAVTICGEAAVQISLKAKDAGHWGDLTDDMVTNAKAEASKRFLGK